MTTTATRQTQKPARFVTWLNHVGYALGTLRIRLVYPSGREEVDLYEVSPLPCDGGASVGFRLGRIDPVDGAESEPSNYDVHLDGGDWPGSCECKGMLRWGHLHPCKHLAAMTRLAETDSL